MVESDPVVIAFLKENPFINKKIFKGKETKSSDIASQYGEEKWRDLEALFIKDFLQNTDQLNKLIDIGGKAFLHTKTQETFRSKHYIPIFLYAEHSTIISHLSENENWKKRSMYEKEGEGGWKNLAIKHRQERMSEMISQSNIIINVTQLSAKFAAKEILYRMRECTLMQEQKDSYQNRIFR